MPILVKAIVIILLLFVLYSLGSALFYLVRDKADSTRVVKALTVRIVLSLIVFILLFAAFALGWITPHSVGG